MTFIASRDAYRPQRSHRQVSSGKIWPTWIPSVNASSNYENLSQPVYHEKQHPRRPQEVTRLEPCFQPTKCPPRAASIAVLSQKTARYKAERILVLTGLVKFALVITGGAVGFSLIEDKSALDGIYWAAVTAATVGYGDITPKTEGPSREYFHWVMMQTSNIMNFALQPLKEPSVVWCDAI